MIKEHLERLVDPIDGAPLGLQPGAGALVASCGRTYPLKGGVPRFVPDDGYVSSFSFEWLTHHRTQFDDERSSSSWRDFQRRTGFDPGLVKGARVLDAGVGSGRYADVALRMGAAAVMGLDLSRAVESAERNLGQDPRFGVVQADLFAPPFADETFDLIYAIGVLHHTPAPRTGFERLVRLLKPGGRIAIYVYKDTPTLRVSDALRMITTRIEPDLLYRWVKRLDGPLHRITETALGASALRWLPRSHNPRADWRVLDTFDWYSPRYQFRYAGAEEICDWFKAAGLVDVRPLDYEICVQGRKPTSRSA